ncbi:MAG: MerR family transcriptional regulator [Enterococcus viikkiensis]|uniref:MerR family transcriptional regulator n=1 Tax=Enterococcus viikkiensis TaxID=930854 RepID=A0ABU3FRQ9_9ENTE|nr:MerR family transcriptional regulator [Enterococcus viikkiensis]MDT2828665.1 MerR family transcriptional regulator [Enterococcus viikkiensis]
MKNNTVKQLLESDDLLVGISELSKVTGVSPRQIRYWEQKGYIHSAGEKSGNRQFKLPMVIKVEIIKHFLDEGYTLTVAVEKAKERQENVHHAKLLLRDTFKGIQNIGNRYTVIQLDDFVNQAGFYLIRDNQTNQSTYQMIEEAEITEDLLEKWFESKEK